MASLDASEPGKRPASVVSSLSSRSCTACRRRKVKCDKSNPCANCIKYGVSCIFPMPGRVRPKPRLRTIMTVDRIQGDRAGNIFNALSRSPKPITQGGSEISHDSNDLVCHLPVHDEMIVDKERWIERSWYLGDRLPRSSYQFEMRADSASQAVEESVYTISLARLAELFRWSDDSESDHADSHVYGDILSCLEVENSDPAEQFLQTPPITTADQAFVLGETSHNQSLAELHPSASQIPFYWQTFVENVDPVVKIFHIPTTGQVIRDFQRRIRSLGPPEEALLFAIYFATVTSMTPNDVRELLNEDKATLVTRFRSGTEQALARAEFMTSTDMTTLRAFVLFISCLRPYVQPRFAGHLAAVAVRMAQGLRLHQTEPFQTQSPYESEMRKRLWLSVWLLDLRTALDLGMDWLIEGGLRDVDLPLNINDTEFNPTSLEYPVPKIGATDMSHVLVKYELAYLTKELRKARTGLGISERVLHWENMEQMITNCKLRVQSTYLRYFADSDPLQWLSAANARLFFAKVPLTVYRPILNSAFEEAIPQETRDRLLEAACETIECSHVLETMSSPCHRGWLFCTTMHWHAMVFILETLCLQSNRTKAAQRAWNAIELALGFWTTRTKPAGKDGAWAMLLALMMQAKRRRKRNLSLYIQEGNLVDSDEETLSLYPPSGFQNSADQVGLQQVSDNGYMQSPGIVDYHPPTRFDAQMSETYWTMHTSAQSMTSEYLTSQPYDGTYISSLTNDNASISGDSLKINRDPTMFWLEEESTACVTREGNDERADAVTCDASEDWDAWNELFAGFSPTI